MSEQLLEKGFLIEPNNAYNILDVDQKAQLVFQNAAERVTHNGHSNPSNSTSSLEFNFRVAEEFLDRAPVIVFDSIPLTFKRKTVTTGDSTKDNFVTGFFDSYKEFAISHLGFYNCIESITVKIDSFSQTINKPADILRALSAYYPKEDVSSYLDHSLPDVHQKFVTNSNTADIDVISSDGNQFNLQLPFVNNLSPFTCSFNSDYGTRLPNLEFSSLGPTRDIINCNLKDISLYLLPTIFNIPHANKQSFYNITDVVITLKFKSTWTNDLFCVANKDSTNAISDVSFNNTSNLKIASNIYFKSYTAPNYIEKKRIEFRDRNYAMSYPMSEIMLSNTYVTLKEFEKKSFILRTFTLRAIPKYILVWAKKRRDDTNKLFEPHTFARIENLIVSMNGSTTNINNGSTYLYHLAKEKGLNISKENALYTSSYCVLIDVSNSLGLKTDSLIGTSDNMKSLSISGEVRNLCDITTGGTLEDTFDIEIMPVYNTILLYNAQSRKFDIIDSFSVDTMRAMSAHVGDLYDYMIKDSSVLGGSFWSAISGALKKVGQGSYNLIKNAISNKNGFRDKLVDAWNDKPENFVEQRSGGAVVYSPGNTVAGSQYSNNIPIGGKSMDRWTSVRK